MKLVVTLSAVTKIAMLTLVIGVIAGLYFGR
jgi:hypothetical protein